MSARPPYSLVNWGDVRLGELDVHVLRQLCNERGIEIADRAHADTCVKKLLEWKRARPSPSNQDVTPRPPRSLENWGDVRLQKLDVHVLRELCNERGIQIADGIAAGACVTKLLAWKDKNDPAKRFQGFERSTWQTGLTLLVRRGVRMHADTKLTTQNNKGAYSLRPLKREDAQVDHIWECQAMGAAILLTEDMRYYIKDVIFPNDGDAARISWKDQGYGVQSALKHVVEVHNDAEFLCATEAAINLQKRFAFTPCLKTLGNGQLPENGSLRAELVRSFSSGANAFSPDDADELAGNVIRSLDAIQDPLTTRLRDASGESRMRGAYEQLSDTMVYMFDRMEITSSRRA
mmetsp:Transcript_3541/g.9165  ORF Transcript_3541/g.9165 Transcript_3541/m.9165 type:complete len:348 (-) Transcript_3541:103-1146(-)